MERTIFFAHGKESGPWGTKFQALAEVAKGKGYRVESPDYSDLMDPDKRVERLARICNGLGRPAVLVGSSMGAYVSIVASADIRPVALFLMAPAVYIPGYREQEPEPHAGKTVIVHGWNDEIIPSPQIFRFARINRAQLHLVESDHRLEDQIPFLTTMFGRLLDEISLYATLSPSPASGPGKSRQR